MSFERYFWRLDGVKRKEIINLTIKIITIIDMQQVTLKLENSPTYIYNKKLSLKKMVRKWSQRNFLCATRVSLAVIG